MSPSAPDPTRERLLNAAGEVFAEKGFKAATVRDICGRVGANLAAVNYHFRDKSGLYIEAVKAAHCSSMQASPEWPPGMSTGQKLHVWVREMLSQLLDPTRPAWHARLMMRELAEPTEACAALVESYIRPSAQLLEEILRDPLNARPGQPPLNHATFYLHGFSVVAQCLFFKVQRPIAELLVGTANYATYSVDVLAEHITRFSLRGMGLDADWSPAGPGLAEEAGSESWTTATVGGEVQP
jgi:AcrR family transcriptional regulator